MVLINYPRHNTTTNLTSAHLQTNVSLSGKSAKYVVSVSISVIVSLHYDLQEEFTAGSAELSHRGAGTGR